MKLEDIKLGISPLTNTIFMGIAKGDVWKEKIDFTSDVIRTVVAWVGPGYCQTVTDATSGQQYEITVKEVKA